MSNTSKTDTLCERCSLLSFDDGALGGQGIVDEDGVVRLYIPESRFEKRYHYISDFGYELIRLDWSLDEILPGMPRLSLSSQLGCVFCQALRKSLEEILAEVAKIEAIADGPLRLVAYLALIDGGIEGLVIEGCLRHFSSYRVIQTFFEIEADSSKSDRLTKTRTV